jgi:hypothetical protein
MGSRSLAVLHVPFYDALQTGAGEDDHVIEASRRTDPMNRST